MAEDAKQLNGVIGPDSTVRDVLNRYPEAQEVFDRHGLGGCGGPLGPMEPIAFFAIVHKVKPNTLLDELNEFVAALPSKPAQGPSQTQSSSTKAAPATIYAPFIKVSLTIAVLAGFSMGVWALLAATGAATLGPLSWLALVQVHGEVQLWGFIGLFIMGVGYFAAPRFRGTALSGPRRSLALASLWLLLSGVILRFAQLALPHAWAYASLLASSTLMAAAAGLFTWIMGRTLKEGGPWEGYEGYLLAGALWFFASGLFQLASTAWLWTAGATVLPAHLDESFLAVMVFGFILMMVLGVSVRALPSFLGLRAPKAFAVKWSLRVLNVGAVALMLGFILTGSSASAGRWLWAAGSLVELAGVALFVGGLRLLEPRSMAVPDLAPQGIPSSYWAFIRSAYVWLLGAVALGAVLALKAGISGQMPGLTALSAARHAMLLGFVTLMVFAMAARIVPVFGGTRLFSAKMQLAALWLLLASVGLRVAVELGWGYGTGLDPLLDLSGVLGLVAVILFAVNIWLTMDGRAPQKAAKAATAPARIITAITQDTPLVEIAARLPESMNILAAHGLSMLREAGHRDAAINTLTLGQAARVSHVDVQLLLKVLNGTTSSEGPAGPAIAADMVVGEVLSHYPETLPVFVAKGFTPLADPAMREKMAGTLTVVAAARVRGIDPQALVEALNEAVNHKSQPLIKQADTPIVTGKI